MVIGHLKPVVLLPASLIAGLSPQQIEAVLAHELAHIRRHDFLINVILSGLEIILFYHPAFWWMAKQIRREREQCCDDIAVATCGNARSYAKTLLIMEEKRQQRSLAMAFQGNKEQLLHRIKRVCLNAPRHRQGDLTKAFFALILVLSVGAFAWASIPEHDLPDDPTTFNGERNHPIEEAKPIAEPVATPHSNHNPEPAAVPTLEVPALPALPSANPMPLSQEARELPKDRSAAPLSVLDAPQKNEVRPTSSYTVLQNVQYVSTRTDSVPLPRFPKVQDPTLPSFPELPYYQRGDQKKLSA